MQEPCKAPGEMRKHSITTAEQEGVPFEETNENSAQPASVRLV